MDREYEIFECLADGSVMWCARASGLQNTARAKLLRSLGYAVLSAVGNEAAKFLITTLRLDNLGIGFFIVGHGAPVQTRKEMVDWLKVNYPKARILALNPPKEQVPDADYNAEEDRLETWVPLVWPVPLEN